MNFFEAAILGTVQGLTEFLPVSSSGHLVVAEKLLGIQQTQSLIFEVIVHLATLLAVITFFWKDILKLKKHEYLLLGIGTIPAVAFGFLFKDTIERAFGSTLQVGIEFLITAGMLFLAQHKLQQQVRNPEKNFKEISYKKSFLIGIWQAISIMPAISRSGATVTGAVLMNIERETAFRFSFLLSIPAILGALALTILNIIQDPSLIVGEQLLPYLFGSIFAFIFGFISLGWFKQVIQKTQLHWFAIYCVVLGVVTIGVALQTFN